MQPKLAPLIRLSNLAKFKLIRHGFESYGNNGSWRGGKPTRRTVSNELKFGWVGQFGERRKSLWLGLYFSIFTIFG